MKRKLLSVIKIVAVQFVISMLLVLIAALITYKISPSQAVVKGMVVAIYAISGLIGGYIIGKTMTNRKFLWGMAAGCIYICIILAVSLIINGSVDVTDVGILPSFMAAVVGGMCGGMIS